MLPIAVFACKNKKLGPRKTVDPSVDRDIAARLFQASILLEIGASFKLLLGL